MHRQYTILLCISSGDSSGITLVFFRDTEVVVVATGGVETNGGRAGDPATVYECNGKFERITGDSPTPGTINTMIFVSKELTKRRAGPFYHYCHRSEDCSAPGMKCAVAIFKWSGHRYGDRSDWRGMSAGHRSSPPFLRKA
ncbi:MAG: adenosylcobinamide amidohydrolase [Deltaproteobacteria bacterium]|nr:adenosylcobinamide amidohydrolase [Deltaproteobacteria bacterium]